MTFEYNIDKRVVADVDGNELMAVDALETMLGKSLPSISKVKKTRRSKAYMRSVPWKFDFKNNCVKCNRAYHLQRHHITYNPKLVVFLCETCHSRITGINTRAAVIAGTSVVFKTTYTNKIRVILWRYFIKTPWPLDKKKKPIRRLSKLKIREILSGFNHLESIGNNVETPSKYNSDIGPDKTSDGICTQIARR